MEQFIKVIGLMIRWKGKEYLSMKTVKFMMENGKKIYIMELVFLLTQNLKE